MKDTIDWLITNNESEIRLVKSLVFVLCDHENNKGFHSVSSSSFVPLCALKLIL